MPDAKRCTMKGVERETEDALHDLGWSRHILLRRKSRRAPGLPREYFPRISHTDLIKPECVEYGLVRLEKVR